ncbi:hypothetical protein ACPEAN_17905 (plasmid) [Ralstonia solanacearum]|uniref:hypothetical protein n=1 Tax=Ralstonia solanacearum TaxID=305 RepID=UPI003CC508CD
MATVSISGLPALSLLAGFVAAATVPVWMGARVVGAERATILRSAVAPTFDSEAAHRHPECP